MAKNVNHVSHIKSTSSAITSGNSVFIADGKAGPKLPVASTLIQGEIAVNLAKDVETLSIVNTSGEIVTFSSDKIIKKVIVDNEQVVAAALNDLEERKQNKLTAGDGITIDDHNVISADVSVEINPVDLPISGGSENDYSENDVPSAGSVIERFLADENRISEIDRVSAAAINDLNTKVNNKVNNSTYATYTANTQTILEGKQNVLTAGENITISSDNVISATDTTYTAGEGISISSSNVISNTAITVVDDALDSGSTNPVANSAVTEAISALTVEVRNNELVDAAALNDLNNRKLDASALTEVNEHIGNENIHVTLDEKQKWNSSISGVNFDGSAVTVSNGVATINVNEYFNGAEYNSNDKKIYFKHNGTTLTAYTIDAADFIKDGMVNTVAISDVASGESTVKCLVVTFNTDAGKQDINIPLSEIFDSSLYYTKTEIDDKLGSGFTGSSSGVTVTQAINDSERVVAAALNDLEVRKLDASAYTPTDLSNYYTKPQTDELLSAKADTTWVEEKLGSGFTGNNSGNTVTKVIEENELVVAAALNDLEAKKLDVSAYTEPDYSELYALSGEVKSNELVVSAALNNLNSRTNELGNYVNDKLGSGFTGETSEGTVTDALNYLDENKQDVLSAGTNVTITNNNVISAVDTTYLAGSGVTISGDSNEISVKIVELRSGATYADDEIPSAKSVKQTIVDNELVVASALNDLEGRKLDASAFTETANAVQTLSGDVKNNELVVAASLNDLNTRLLEVTGDVYDNTNEISEIKEIVSNLSPSIVEIVSTLPSTAEASTGKIYLVPNSSSGTQNSYIEYVYLSGTTSWEKVGEWKPDIVVESGITSGSTNPVQSKAIKAELDKKQDTLTAGSGITIDSANTISVIIDTDSDEWSSGSTGVPATSALAEVLEEIEEVTATALNDLNDRLLEVSGNQLTASSFKTINGQTIVGSGNISIEGSGGGQPNVIEIVKVNGTELNPDSSKAVNIASIPSSIVTQDATHRFVSDTEKSTWNSKQNAFSNASTLSGISATNVTNWNSVTAKTDTTAFTAHTGDTTVHVTAAERTTWNGKQDSISDLASIRTSAATQSDWNATSGVAMIKNKPTIPAAPGTLTTTATTTQATATNEALSGSISLHKVSKTGSYNDLNNKPTIPTVSNSTVTLTFNGATVGSFTLNGTGGTIDIGTVIGLPSFSAANNGQILGVVNGQLAWITPTTIYTGSGTPSSSTGNDGDIYLQTS